MQNWTRLSNSTLIKLIWVTIRRLFWFGIITNYSINPIGLTWVPNVTNVIFFSLCRMVTLAQKLKILDFFLLEFKRNSCMNLETTFNVTFIVRSYYYRSWLLRNIFSQVLCLISRDQLGIRDGCWVLLLFHSRPGTVIN